MKTLKKLASLVFALVLGASLMAAPALAFADVSYDKSVASSLESGMSVIDDGNLLSNSVESTLNSKGQSIRSKYKVATYYITTDSLEGYSSAESYAKAYAKEYGLQNYASKGCVIFLLCVNEGYYSLTALGDASDTFSNSTLDYLDSDISPYLGRSDWEGAGETFFGDVSQTLSGKKANATSDIAYTKGSYVIDDYGLFSNEDRNQLEAKAQELAAQYNMGVYLLVVDNMGSQNPSSAERTNFATSFYRANNLGLGKGKDGIMLVIAAGSRDYVTIAYGQGSYSFSDEGISAMEDAVTEYLGDDDWYGGSREYYNRMDEQLAYYDANGEPWTEPDLFSLLLKILATLGIPAGVAGAKISGERAAMKTAREKNEASNYLVEDSFVLTASTDTFVNTTLAVTPKPKNEDSDGGGFGGGGWGGGGGGGFSSSGGGKF